MSLNYSYVIQDMTWSYSRLTQFESCRYGWLLKYVHKEKSGPLFFASYGSFMHEVMAKYLLGQLGHGDLVGYFVARYHTRVEGRPPNPNLHTEYLCDGVRYLAYPGLDPAKALDVEHYDQFTVAGFPFQGYIDLIMAEDNGKLSIVDHKSRALKPRSNRKNSRSNAELDKYLRQLYLYSIPFKNQYGRWPDNLCFNCFREGVFIAEPFDEAAFESAVEWAQSLICAITDNEDWAPSIEPFKCRYLCDVHEQCEYYQLIKSGEIT